MIYTLTFNPSLDYIVTVPKFTCGVVNRTTEEIIFPGGKGINVSMVLKNLGFENTALGFYAGFTGMELKRLVADKGIHAEFIPVDKGMTRINVKLRSEQESEINGQGPAIAASDIDKLYEKLGCTGGWRHTCHGGKYSGCDAADDVHGYHEASAGQELKKL